VPAQDADSDTIRLWSDASGAGPGPLHGDTHAARERVAAAAGDSAAVLPLRLVAPALADGTDWSRVDDQAVVDQIGAALAQGRLLIGATQQLQLRRLVSAEPPVPPPPPPPPAAASAPRSAPAAAPPPAVETTFGSELDVQAMVAVLVQAAQDGVPFCEECARAAAEAAA